MKFLLAALALLCVLVVCTYAAEPVKAGDCNIELGLECAGALANCFPECKHFKENPDACFNCLGGSVSTCCPCLQKAFGPTFPC